MPKLTAREARELSALRAIYLLQFEGVDSIGGVHVTLGHAPLSALQIMLGSEERPLRKLLTELDVLGHINRHTLTQWNLPNPLRLALPDGRAMFIRVDLLDGFYYMTVAAGILVGRKLTGAKECPAASIDGWRVVTLTKEGLARLRALPAKKTPALRKPGRPTGTHHKDIDPEADKKLYKQWCHARDTRRLTIAEFAKGQGLKTRDVTLTIQRVKTQASKAKSRRTKPVTKSGQ